MPEVFLELLYSDLSVGMIHRFELLRNLYLFILNIRIEGLIKTALDKIKILCLKIEESFYLIKWQVLEIMCFFFNSEISKYYSLCNSRTYVWTIKTSDRNRTFRSGVHG